MISLHDMLTRNFKVIEKFQYHNSDSQVIGQDH